MMPQNHFHTNALTVAVSLNDLVVLVNIYVLVGHSPDHQMLFLACGVTVYSSSLPAWADTNSPVQSART